MTPTYVTPASDGSGTGPRTSGVASGFGGVVPSASGATSPVYDTRPVRPFCVFTFFQWLSYAMIITELSALIEKLYNQDSSSAALFLGLLSIIFPLCQFFFNPIFGYFSDHGAGRKPFLYGAAFGVLAKNVIAAITLSKEGLIAAFVIFGVLNCTNSISSASLIDLSKGDQVQYAVYFGSMLGCIGLALIIGPLISIIFAGASGSDSLPFWVAAVTALLSFAVLYFYVPETFDKNTRRLPRGADPNEPGAKPNLMAAMPWNTMRLLGRSPRLTWLAFCKLFTELAIASLSMWFIYATDRWNLDKTLSSIILFIFGVSVALGLMVSLRWAVPKWGETISLYFTCFFHLLFFFGLTYSGSPYGVLLVCIFIVPFGSFHRPLILGHASREVSLAEQGQLHGAIAYMDNIGAFLGTLIAAGVLAVAVAPDASSSKYVPVAPWVVAMGFCVCALICAYVAMQFPVGAALSPADLAIVNEIARLANGQRSVIQVQRQSLLLADANITTDVGDSTPVVTIDNATLDDEPVGGTRVGGMTVGGARS